MPQFTKTILNGTLKISVDIDYDGVIEEITGEDGGVLNFDGVMFKTPKGDYRDIAGYLYDDVNECLATSPSKAEDDACDKADDAWKDRGVA